MYFRCTCCPCRDKRATLIQSYVRMHQQRGRFRRETEAGRRAAARAASAARAAAAATVLQAYTRRWHARRKVQFRCFLHVTSASSLLPPMTVQTNDPPRCKLLQVQPLFCMRRRTKCQVGTGFK